MKNQIESLVKQNKTLTAISRELGLKFPSNLNRIIKEYWPETRGNFTDLRLMFGLTPYPSTPLDCMEKVPGGVLVYANNEYTFRNVPVAA